MIRLSRLSALIFAVLLGGCASSGNDATKYAAPTPPPSVTATGATYQQEAMPARAMTPAEKQAYLQRFTAEMARIQVQRDTGRRREEQLEREAAARQEPAAGAERPAAVPGWDGSPPATAPPSQVMGGGIGPNYEASSTGFTPSGFPSGNGFTAPPQYNAPAPVSQDDPNRIVYVTNTGSKYHADGCRYLRRSQNPMRFRDAAQSYSACSVCGGG